MSVRTITVKIHDVRVEKSWSGSKLFIEEYGDVIGPWKRAVVQIKEPSDINYIRQKLDEIEAYWKERLGIKS